MPPCGYSNIYCALRAAAQRDVYTALKREVAEGKHSSFLAGVQTEIAVLRRELAKPEGSGVVRSELASSLSNYEQIEALLNSGVPIDAAIDQQLLQFEGELAGIHL